MRVDPGGLSSSTVQHFQSQASAPLHESGLSVKGMTEDYQTDVCCRCRHIDKILRQEDWVVKAKKVFRLHRSRACNCITRQLSGAQGAVARGPCVHDRLATGHKLPILLVIHTYARLSPVVALRFNYGG